jgi:hypothetical protein
MTLTSPPLRRFARRVLVDATGVPSPNPAQLASAFDDLCGRLRRRLLPLFGTAAVTALLVRALHVTAAEFPWLSDLVRRNQDPCAAELVAAAGSLEIAALEEGLAAVLAHNVGLLNAFIGEDLVLPLVQEAWGTSAAPRTEDQP